MTPLYIYNKQSSYINPIGLSDSADGEDNSCYAGSGIYPVMPGRTQCVNQSRVHVKGNETNYAA